MRKTFYLIVMLFLAACSDNSDYVTLSSRLVLKDITLENNRIKLEWNRPYMEDFSYYTIYRSDVPGTNFTYINKIEEISDIDKTVYFDKTCLEENVYYTVVAYRYENDPLFSNTLSFSRNDVVVFEEPNDVVFYPEKKNLFVFLNTAVFVVDYEEVTITDTIVLNSVINTGFIGNYNGKDEMYFGCSDGYVRIFDIDNLNEINSFYVGGSVNNIVTDNYNNLYVSNSNRLYSYDRATLSYIDTYSGSVFYVGKKKHLKQSDRIVGFYGRSHYLSYYDHDIAGNFTDSDNEYISTSYRSTLLEVFNDIIFVGSHCSVYTKDLNYITQLGDYSDEFSSVFIDDLIYVADMGNKEIKSFSKTSYLPVNTYSCGLYPLIIFKIEEELIIIGTNFNEYQYISDEKYGIEKITLN
jgi:hypothetical protein